MATKLTGGYESIDNTKQIDILDSIDNTTQRTDKRIKEQVDILDKINKSLIDLVHYTKDPNRHDAIDKLIRAGFATKAESKEKVIQDTTIQHSATKEALKENKDTQSAIEQAALGYQAYQDAEKTIIKDVYGYTMLMLKKEINEHQKNLSWMQSQDDGSVTQEDIKKEEEAITKKGKQYREAVRKAAKDHRAAQAAEEKAKEEYAKQMNALKEEEERLERINKKQQAKIEALKEEEKILKQLSEEYSVLDKQEKKRLQLKLKTDEEIRTQAESKITHGRGFFERIRDRASATATNRESGSIARLSARAYLGAGNLTSWGMDKIEPVRATRAFLRERRDRNPKNRLLATQRERLIQKEIERENNNNTVESLMKREREGDEQRNGLLTGILRKLTDKDSFIGMAFLGAIGALKAAFVSGIGMLGSKIVAAIAGIRGMMAARGTGGSISSSDTDIPEMESSDKDKPNKKGKTKRTSRQTVDQFKSQVQSTINEGDVSVKKGSKFIKNIIDKSKHAVAGVTGVAVAAGKSGFKRLALGGAARMITAIPYIGWAAGAALTAYEFRDEIKEGWNVLNETASGYVEKYKSEKGLEKLSTTSVSSLTAVPSGTQDKIHQIESLIRDSKIENQEIQRAAIESSILASTNNIQNNSNVIANNTQYGQNFLFNNDNYQSTYNKGSAIIR